MTLTSNDIAAGKQRVQQINTRLDQLYNKFGVVYGEKCPEGKLLCLEKQLLECKESIYFFETYKIRNPNNESVTNIIELHRNEYKELLSKINSI